MKFLPSSLFKYIEKNPKLKRLYYDIKLYPYRCWYYKTLFPLRKKYREASKKRKRARYLALHGNRKSVSYSTRQFVLARAGHRCENPECGKCVYLTMDHVVPWARGGTNDPYNLQALCAQCNTDKGDKTIDYRRFGWQDFKMPKKIAVYPSRSKRAKLSPIQKANANSIRRQVGLEELV